MKFLWASPLAIGVAAAQAAAWAQCGGTGYTGATTCTSGYSCVFVNAWYSQCQPGGGSGSGTTLTTTTSRASSTATSTQSSGSSPTLSPGVARYLGRVNPATKELTWPGTGVAFTFTGKSASIGLSSVTGDNSVDLIVDGGAPVVISNLTGNSISTPAGLSQGTHTVEIRKRSEAYFGSIVIGEITTDGKFGVNPVPAKKIEIIGDSITVGYGLDGVNPCPNTAAVEDNPKTYEAVAANSLGADYRVVAWSGKGLVRNIATGTTDTSPLMPELYTRYGANDADNSYPFSSDWTPDAVVINLGTNDFSYLAYDASGQSYKARSPINATTFTDGMVDFVRSIQTHYPRAKFFLLTSPMLSDYFPTAADAQHTTQKTALQSAISQLGSNAYLVDWPTQGSDVGCDYHPNASTHAAGAAILVSAIRSALGW
ncbi:hypothetical protein POX_g09330 [Penicillium oxalicum]|uniref:Putative acetyl xylan esterase n=1 Tax=Penicillium oxalicum (strain 114-2 / CGMCC 5302) TaxID=933388 RepID=S7ZCF1_PENO1|nr:hypothetical protein POX_g09330 [Penicillium oxalicum]EPS26366.1 putative acetyl xylan esterase [Penicillium oxalicum 114-2]KAI2786933.1 hypothetical protein POX_g09330 [Penicillium oxalicum]